jgi:hypothetical protein
MKDIIPIITGWVDYCRANGLYNKAYDFWLLWDFADGVFDSDYYFRYAEKAKKILLSLDLEKEQAKKVYTALLPVIDKYLPKVEK